MNDTEYDIKALVRSLTLLRAGYDLLSQVWNQSLCREDREAIGQDRMSDTMHALDKQIKALSAVIYPSRGDAE